MHELMFFNFLERESAVPNPWIKNGQQREHQLSIISSTRGLHPCTKSNTWIFPKKQHRTADTFSLQRRCRNFEGPAPTYIYIFLFFFFPAAVTQILSRREWINTHVFLKKARQQVLLRKVSTKTLRSTLFSITVGSRYTHGLISKVSMKKHVYFLEDSRISWDTRWIQNWRSSIWVLNSRLGSTEFLSKNRQPTQALTIFGNTKNKDTLLDLK
jgi:hypothetical protein